MTVLTWADLIAHKPPFDLPVRLTIGVFDGVHVGHRRLFSEVVGGGSDTLSLVMTFPKSPVGVRSPDTFPGFDPHLRPEAGTDREPGRPGGRGN